MLASIQTPNIVYLEISYFELLAIERNMGLISQSFLRKNAYNIRAKLDDNSEIHIDHSGNVLSVTILAHGITYRLAHIASW